MAMLLLTRANKSTGDARRQHQKAHLFGAQRGRVSSINPEPDLAIDPKTTAPVPSSPAKNRQLLVHPKSPSVPANMDIAAPLLFLVPPTSPSSIGQPFVR